ncbi:MAG: VirB3 family type IV secretion system protein [Spirochaetaceae bacterium]|nr:VirB3 family type IV secretion system protein [Spirochaetaceae bacterium]MBQ4555083.1 VirB3 family type IV secretion system protein [Spirochaetaceae bacterium]
MENYSLYDYSTPVHKVLLEPNQLLGIGITPAILILVLTIVLMNLVSIWCCVIGIFLYVGAKMICKNDPYALTILFERLMLPNIWRAS